MQIFILAGQSNMSGRGDVRELPEGFPSYVDRLWVLGNDDKWRPAAEPLDDSVGQVDMISVDILAGVGPGLAFAERLASLRPGIDIGLVPCARGGASMDQWLHTGGRATLYGSCKRRYELAAQRGSIAGLLWYQGEADTGSEELVQQWPAKFKTLAGRFRKDLQNPTLPVVFVQIGDLGRCLQNDPRKAMWRGLQNVQAKVKIPYVKMVSAIGLPLMSDGIHLSTKAELILGAETADAMDRLMTIR